MGGEKFDTPHPEGYLFGENMDLNFLGSRPVQVGLGRLDLATCIQVARWADSRAPQYDARAQLAFALEAHECAV